MYFISSFFVYYLLVVVVCDVLFVVLFVACALCVL